jgi:hypothetical protein
MVTLYVKRNEEPAKERTGGLRSGGVEAIPPAPKGRGAPLDGTPFRLFVSAGYAIASFWSAERSQEAFGDGDYRGAGLCSMTTQSSPARSQCGQQPCDDQHKVVLFRKIEKGQGFDRSAALRTGSGNIRGARRNLTGGHPRTARPGTPAALPCPITIELDVGEVWRH